MSRRGRNTGDEATTPFSAAHDTARREVARLARDFGAGLVTRPVSSLKNTPVTRDVEPLAGIYAAVNLEVASQIMARDYIRQAREAGHGWDQIGQALDLEPGSDEAGATPAGIAYDYAAGRPDPKMPWHPRSFWWTCRSCDLQITDRGLISGPADDEIGHADGCRRLAAAIATWDAQAADRETRAADRATRVAAWLKDPDAEWEAGQ